MPPESESESDDPDTDQVVSQVIAELDPDPVTLAGDSIVINRRWFLSALGASTVAGAFVKMGIDEASAQSAAGAVGTQSEPLEMWAAAGNVLHDGDDVERRVWVIANGASDPSGASAEDLIFEEES
jgi:hypothetical protein